MRIWSLHPKYLDTKGLVALWRGALLAKHVLEGKTKGYKNHPQLNRFKKLNKPAEAINQYLSVVYAEASNRGYNFDGNKIDWNFKACQTTVTKEQVEYETAHLLKKLELRDKEKFKAAHMQTSYDLHPKFIVIEGKIEDWENWEKAQGTRNKVQASNKRKGRSNPRERAKIS